MPAVLMENPKHGFHHFYSPQEVEAAKENGWVVVEPPKAMEPAVIEPPKTPPPKAVKKK